MEVSDWPNTCTPEGVTSSFGLAASTFEPKAEPLLVPFPRVDWGPKHCIWRPDDAQMGWSGSGAAMSRTMCAQN